MSVVYLETGTVIFKVGWGFSTCSVALLYCVEQMCAESRRAHQASCYSSAALRFMGAWLLAL